MTSTAMTNSDTAERLLEIQDEMQELFEEAKRLLRDSSEKHYAEAYFIPHMGDMLGDGHASIGELAQMLEARDDEDAEDSEE